MRVRAIVLSLVLFGLSVGTPAQPAAEKVAVKVVRYDGLTDLLKQQRGKVVVVDFWADYCVPCKREFPKLVALHGKYARDGLAAVSVSLDDLGEEGAKDKVVKFLEKQRATFTNLILDEKPALWQAKLKIDGPPLVVVYNRDGGVARRFPSDDDPNAVDYAKVEKVVVELLKKK